VYDAGAPISTPLHGTGSATLAAMAARLPCWLALAAMALPVFPIGGEEARGAVGPPSLLLITLDTTRADALGAWGGGATASTRGPWPRPPSPCRLTPPC
jgi:hypothetical protein